MEKSTSHLPYKKGIEGARGLGPSLTLFLFFHSISLSLAHSLSRCKPTLYAKKMCNVNKKNRCHLILISNVNRSLSQPQSGSLESIIIIHMIITHKHGLKGVKARRGEQPPSGRLGEQGGWLN